MRRQQNAELEQIEPEIARMSEEFGYELVWAELRGPSGRQTLTIYIDKPGGVTSDDCAQMVKRVSVLLETLDSPRDSYGLVVSSPGLERPLTDAGDLIRFAGQKAALTIEQAQGKTTLTGTLQEVSGGCVVLGTDGGTVQVPLADLVAAHLVSDWDDE